MPISQFAPGLQKIISFLPGTYGTSLLRNHAMAGVYREMEAQGFPAEVVSGIRDSVDCNIYFSGKSVPVPTMYLVLVGATVLVIAAYVVICRAKRRS